MTNLSENGFKAVSVVDIGLHLFYRIGRIFQSFLRFSVK